VPLTIDFSSACQFEKPPYPDKGAKGGMLPVIADKLDDVIEAPESGYLYHWITPVLGGIYCVRTRDGEHYAKIQVTDIAADHLSFDWVYQPNGTRFFAKTRERE
jgi:hypothetical protein